MIFLRYLFSGWVFEFKQDNIVEFTNPTSKTKYQLVLDAYDYNGPIIRVVSL